MLQEFECHSKHPTLIMLAILLKLSLATCASFLYNTSHIYRLPSQYPVQLFDRTPEYDR